MDIEELRTNEIKMLSFSITTCLEEKEEERGYEVVVVPCCVLQMVGCKEKMIQFRFMLNSPSWNPQI